MPVHREEIVLRTRGETDVVDVTEHVRRVAAAAGGDGLVHVFTPGSTAGLTTLEYEPGCVRDLQELFERAAPRDAFYHHNARWGDGNGFSHARAALLGPSLTVPLADGAPLLGTWQQIVLVDFDNRPRERRLIVSVQAAG